MGDRWRRHEAAHVFPVALARFWDTCGVSSIIQSTDDPVNAVQNGILLLGDLHSQFDQYDVSINPDVGAANVWYAHLILVVGQLQDRIFRSRFLWLIWAIR